MDLPEEEVKRIVLSEEIQSNFLIFFQHEISLRSPTTGIADVPMEASVHKIVTEINEQ